MTPDKRGIVGAASRKHDWSLDGLGNWSGFVVKESGVTTLDQTRTNNKANEISDISTGIDPAYDAAGNMTSGPKPGANTTRLHYEYDAWNRLVAVYADDSGSPGDLIASYEYDGRNYRVEKTVEGTPDVTYDYYFNDDWQVVEVRRDGDANPLEQYVWDERYVDSPVVRFHDGDTDGTIDDTLYYTTDANMNVTALVDASDGSVLERYLYSPYGEVTVLDADWSTDGDGVSDVANTVLFAGYKFDPETGLYLARNRLHDPTLGRWLQRDPIGYLDGMSLYEYVGSAPSLSGDAFGLAWRALGALRKVVRTSRKVRHVLKKVRHRKTEEERPAHRRLFDYVAEAVAAVGKLLLQIVTIPLSPIGCEAAKTVKHVTAPAENISKDARVIASYPLITGYEGETKIKIMVEGGIIGGNPKSKARGSTTRGAFSVIATHEDLNVADIALGLYGEWQHLDAGGAPKYPDKKSRDTAFEGFKDYLEGKGHVPTMQWGHGE